MITLLLKEVGDYGGIASLLDNNKIVTALSKNQDIGIVVKQYRIINEMAYQEKNLSGLIQNSLGLVTTKSFLSHTINSKEILALIAIGESQIALERAYSIPESISKIRLLARTYTTMKERNERIPIDAIDELKHLVLSQNTEEVDKEVIQELAIDIFPILPDTSIEILEKAFSNSEERNLIELALKSGSGSYELNNLSQLSKVSKFQFEPFLTLYPRWLKKLSIDDLRDRIQSLTNNKAKEYMIRRWCIQNNDSADLHIGILLWIETVVNDSTYIVPLRSLRQISNLIKFAEEEEQYRLVKRLEIPSFVSINSPREEWVGFNLNLAEAVFKHDDTEARERIDRIYEIINLDIDDKDIKVFCYARLWATASKYYSTLAEPVKMNFERVLSILLKDAALHDEILNNTLNIIAPIDLEYAIEKALEINTLHRRQMVIKNILITSLRKNPALDITKELENVIQYYDDYQKSFLFRIISFEMYKRDVKLSESNQTLLLRHCRKIVDYSLKAEALINLATNWTNEKQIRVDKLINEAELSWEKEDDLERKISLGYELVERLSKRNLEAAKRFCQKVQNMILQPGAALAAGNLGSTFYKTLQAAIQSLSFQEITSDATILAGLFNLIDLIPSRIDRITCYAQIAARAYTIQYPKEAEEIIRTKVLPEIDNIDNLADKQIAINISLPIIYKYHKDTAYELVKT